MGDEDTFMSDMTKDVRNINLNKTLPCPMPLKRMASFRYEEEDADLYVAGKVISGVTSVAEAIRIVSKIEKTKPVIGLTR